jgi:LPS-assembly protein
MIPGSLLRHQNRVLVGFGLLALAATAAAGQTRVPARRGLAELEAQQQRQEGKIFYADGDVEIRYQEMRLRADHVEYNDETQQARATGHVQFDYRTQHLEASEGAYNLRTGRGEFRDVRGSVRAERRPNPSLLVSPNPLSFEAKKVERLNETTYIIRHAWVTVCSPKHPKWKFSARRAVIRLDRSVHMASVSFRLFSVPVIYLPYASAPAGKNVRQSGFLLPDVGNSSRKGFVLGDSYYLAPADWLDFTLGAQLFSRRGWSQIGEMRARPWENVRVGASYFGVDDRGLRGANGVRNPQGGEEAHFDLDALLPQGWRAVADLNQLSNLQFRLAFAETFSQAINPEVRSAAFLTNNFRGFRLNFAALNYKNFLTVTPETAVVLRKAPEARLDSVDLAPWRRWPVYFGLEAFADAVHRSDPRPSETPDAAQRTEIAPRVTVPLRWGPWLGLTSSFLVRATRYGAQQAPDGSGTVLPEPLTRTTKEVTADLRLPSLARVWGNGGVKWKHAIEPDVTYRYVNGVNQFGKFIRFDEDDTLTDTSELEYSLTQRLYRREREGNADGLLSWRVAQKYYFDPTFGGALVPGQRNVFQALDSVTPFAFADTPRRFSPIVSDLRITPGGRYDAQFRVDYDPVRGKAAVYGTLLKIRPYREAFVTLAHFSIRSNTLLEPLSDQIRALVGYGELNRRGWNASFGVSYDARQRFFQNQIAQVSYNGSCCGIALEFRRLALGAVRSENQFRVAFLIANLGTFGNLRRQEKIF